MPHELGCWNGNRVVVPFSQKVASWSARVAHRVLYMCNARLFASCVGEPYPRARAKPRKAAYKTGLVLTLCVSHDCSLLDGGSGCFEGGADVSNRTCRRAGRWTWLAILLESNERETIPAFLERLEKVSTKSTGNSAGGSGGVQT